MTQKEFIESKFEYGTKHYAKVHYWLRKNFGPANK